MHEGLLAVTPIDGRYAGDVVMLSPIVSEYGLIHRRVAIEVAWLAVLGSGTLPDMPRLSKAAKTVLHKLVDNFSITDAAAIKEIERTTNHDVKAVEVWLRQQTAGNAELKNYAELIHFGCTSEDINNLAYALIVRDTRDDVLFPGIAALMEDVGAKAEAYADLSMLGHTHGQAATPTTLGKELRVFYDRLAGSRQRLAAIPIRGKFNGATGSYNAASVAYPEVDWPAVSRQFVESLGFVFNPSTTQIEPHDWLAAFCSELTLNNLILTDLSRDMWAYISLGYFKQQLKTGEVGSSTMPHKVNPINFENAESNFGTANALLGSLASRLPISRLQRDLTDSSALRTLGEAFGHTVVAYASLQNGLAKVNPDKRKLAADLDGEWAVLTEAVQTVMRRYKVPGAYDIIKNATRGQTLTQADYIRLVRSLKDSGVPTDAIAQLKLLTPATYIGRAPDIARRQHDAP